MAQPTIAAKQIFSGQKKHLPDRTDSLTCGIAVLFVLSATTTIMMSNQVGDTPTAMGIHPYLVAWCQSNNNVNYISPRKAHIAALALCALFILAGAKFADRISSWRWPTVFNPISIVVMAGFGLSSLYWLYGKPGSQGAWLAVSAIFIALSFGAKFLFKQRVVAKVAIFILACLGLLAIVPGLTVPYDSSWMSPSAFIEFQQGYSVVASQCDRISMGHQIFDSVKPNYGILLQVLCGLWEKYNGIFTLGQNIQIIRWLQALTVAIAFTLYCWYGRFRPLPVAAAFLMVLPWLHTNQISLLFPNLSPWRSFGFPIAFLALVLSRRMSAQARTICLGIVAGICLTLNLETGVSILLGLLCFLYFSERTLSKPFTLTFLKSSALLFTAAAAFAVCLYFSISALFGYLPNLNSYLEHLQMIQEMTKTGYSGGFKFIYSPLPLLVFCHYCYVLFRAGLKKDALTYRECLRASAATVGLVWSAYYFNRPNEWYFQPQYFFYGFLLIDTVRLAQSYAWRSPNYERRSIAILLVCSVVAPQIVSAFKSGWESYSRLSKQCRHGKLGDSNAVLVSGIYVHPEAAEALKAKVGTLNALTDWKHSLYLTGSTVLIPKLTRLYMTTGIDDPYQDLNFVRRTDEFVSRIKQSGIKTIFVDAEDSYLAGDKYRKACWRELKEKLAPEFATQGEENGWTVLVRSTVPQSVKYDIGLDKVAN